MKKPSITLQVAALNKQSPPHTPTEKSAKFTTSTGGQVFKRTPENVTENENERCIILWDMPVYTDKEIKSNRHDIIIKDQELKKCLLIDMAIFAERNTSVKMVEKLSKY